MGWKQISWSNVTLQTIASYNVSSVVLVFSMLSFGRILISKFCCYQSAYVRIHFQVWFYFTWPRLFYTEKCFCMRYILHTRISMDGCLHLHMHANTCMDGCLCMHVQALIYAWTGTYVCMDGHLHMNAWVGASTHMHGCLYMYERVLYMYGRVHKHIVMGNGQDK